MAEGAPYFVDIVVPSAVLLEAAPDAPAAPQPRHPNDCNAMWYRGHADALAQDADGTIQSWRPENHLGPTAKPSAPNTGNARVSDQGGVAFEREVNGGFVAEAMLIDAARFSCAIRFSSVGGQARTLFTMNPPDQDNYFFLTEKDGQLIWQDQQETVAVTLPTPAPDCWVAAGYVDGRLCLAAAGPDGVFCAPVTSATSGKVMAGAIDLFIGCRSHRKGILKTLGHSRIRDVLVWIDQNCLEPGAQDVLQAACLHVEDAWRIA